MSPRPPPVNSTVARALNNFTGTWSRSSTSSTPSQSQPSSPMKKEISPFRFPEGHQTLEPTSETSSSDKRKESIFVQRINSIFQDRLSISTETQFPDKNSLGLRSPAKMPIPEAAETSRDSSSFKFEETTQEDQEVLEISRLGEQLRIDSTTPTNYVVIKFFDRNKRNPLCIIIILIVQYFSQRTDIATAFFRIFTPLTKKNLKIASRT